MKISESEDYSETQLQRLVDQFEADIESISELVFTTGPVKERHVRQASVILRRWICDNELQKITRRFRTITTFDVLDDAHVYNVIAQDDEVRYYISAGVRFNGKPFVAFYHSDSREPGSWVSELERLVDIPMKEVKISSALKKPVLYFEGKTFSMEEVLRFACNKLGGAHTDNKRKDRELVLDRAHEYITFGAPQKNLPSYKCGEIHLEIEPEGEEALSGLFVIVIAAAAMLLGVKFDGQKFCVLSA